MNKTQTNLQDVLKKQKEIVITFFIEKLDINNALTGAIVSGKTSGRNRYRKIDC